jgi:hypothetical protein
LLFLKTKNISIEKGEMMKKLFQIMTITLFITSSIGAVQKDRQERNDDEAVTEMLADAALNFAPLMAALDEAKAEGDPIKIKRLEAELFKILAQLNPGMGM